MPAAATDVFLGGGQYWSVGERAVERYSRDGELLARYDDPAGAGFDHGAVTDNGLFVFAGGYDVDTTAFGAQVVKFDAETLTPITTFGLRDNSAYLNLKVRNGSLYVGQAKSSHTESEAEGFDLRRFDFDGNLLGTWPIRGVDGSNFGRYPAYDVQADSVIFANDDPITHQNIQLYFATLPAGGGDLEFPVQLFDEFGADSGEHVTDIGWFNDGLLVATDFEVWYLFSNTGFEDSWAGSFGGNIATYFVSIDGAVDEQHWVSLGSNYAVYEGSAYAVQRSNRSFARTILFQTNPALSGRYSSAWVARHSARGGWGVGHVRLA